MADVAQALAEAEGDAVREAIAARARDLFGQQERANRRRTDQLFAALLALEWLALVAVASRIAPGRGDAWGLPVLRAAMIGAAFVIGPILAALRWPGRAATRHLVAAGQMLLSALLVHLGDNRSEAHYHVFGSLALLALYRDWRVLGTGTLIVAADHVLRATLAPAGSWPWAEFLGWIGFEDAFLALLCVQDVAELRQAAGRQAALEGARARIERTVVLRDAELTYQADELTLLGHRLRETEAEARKLALVASRAEHAAILADALGRIEWVNEGFTRLLGYTLDEVLGRTATSFLPPGAPEIPARIWSRLRRGEVVRAELVLVARGGGRLRVAAEAHPIRDDPGTLIRLRAIEAAETGEDGGQIEAEGAPDLDAGTDADPTPSHAPRPAVSPRTDGEETAVARGELLAEVARALRARVDGLDGATGVPWADPLRAALDDLDDLARIEAGRLRLDPAPFALREVLAAASGDGAGDGSGPGPAREVGPDVPDALVGDAARLRRVLSHLVGEVSRSAAGDRGRVLTRVRREMRDGSRLLLHFTVAVADAEDPAPAPEDPGRDGLGRALATRLVALMGGRLWVEGEPGRVGPAHFTAEFQVDPAASPRRPAVFEARPIFAGGVPRSWTRARTAGAGSQGN